MDSDLNEWGASQPRDTACTSSLSGRSTYPRDTLQTLRIVRVTCPPNLQLQPGGKDYVAKGTIDIHGMTFLRIPYKTASLSILLFLVAQASAQESSVISQEFDVRPGGTVFLDLDNGTIEVEVGARNRLTVELERTTKSRDRETFEAMLDRHDYELEQEGNDVTVWSRFGRDQRGVRWQRRARVRVKVLLTVPQSYNVTFESGAGNVEITKLHGAIEGHTGAGNIVIEKHRGTLDLTSGAGNMNVSGDLSLVAVKTGAGNIDLRGMLDGLDVVSGAGNVFAEITHQPEKDLKIRTGAGNVTVAIDSDVGLDVEGTASLGSASCEFPLEVTGKLLKKTFGGPINGGGPNLEMRAGVGNVTLKRL